MDIDEKAIKEKAIKEKAIKEKAIKEKAYGFCQSDHRRSEKGHRG